MSIVLLGSTSGSCTLQEQAVAGTTTLTLPTTSGTILTNSSVGTVLQVASAYKTDTQIISSAVPTFVDVTGLSVTLTPTSSSSKFLCIWTVTAANGADQSHGYFRLVRNGTAIGLADTAGSRTSASSSIVNTSIAGQTLTSSNTFLDSPSTTSAVTYKITSANNGAGSSNTLINRSSRDTDSANNDGRSTSSLTVLEIAG